MLYYTPQYDSYGAAWLLFDHRLSLRSFAPFIYAEIDVTRCLAGPFDTGGLLIILQEPLQKHLWSEGANAVISSCPTLDALREGVLIGSNGSFSLLHHISILDIRPFISKQANYSLTEDCFVESLAEREIGRLRLSAQALLRIRGERTVPHRPSYRIVHSVFVE